MTGDRLVRPGSKTAVRDALVAFVAASLLTLIPITAAAQIPKPEVYFVPNVVDQFRALSLRPEPFGTWVWGHPDPEDNIDKHYQGIARTQGPGVPHMFLALERQRLQLRPRRKRSTLCLDGQGSGVGECGRFRRSGPAPLSPSRATESADRVEIRFM